MVYGTWPYSFDTIDLARVIPEAVLSAIAGILADKDKGLWIAGGLGAGMGALARTQILIEMTVYPEEFALGIITPDMMTHQYFIALLDALVAGVAALGITYLVHYLE